MYSALLEKRFPEARRAYYAFVEDGSNQGRRDELTGGGLIRSLGGWSAVKKSRLKGLNHIKSDERILGEPDFVDSILSQADETLERCYEALCRGYDLVKTAERVAVLCTIDMEDIFSKGKQKNKVRARSLLCYWASRELGTSLTQLARRLGLSVPGVGYAVQRGELIARENNYQLLE